MLILSAVNQEHVQTLTSGCQIASKALLHGIQRYYSPFAPSYYLASPFFPSSDSFARNKKVTEIDFCLQVIVTQILTHAHDSISVCLINITHHHDFTKFITLTSQNGERYCHSYVCKHKTVY